MLSIFVGRSALFDHGNANARGQLAHRSGKIDVLIFHDETKNAPAHPASETMKRLPLRDDVKRRRFFLMKWAERPEVRTRAFEWKIRTDHLNDVVGGGNLLDGLRRNCSHV